MALRRVREILLCSKSSLNTLLGISLLLIGFVSTLHTYCSQYPAPSKPLWSMVTLICNAAIEYPLFLAFHPTFLAQRHEGLTLSSNKQLLFQVVVFFAIEIAFQNCILNFTSIESELPESSRNITISPEILKEELFKDAEHAVFDFIRPRGTLLLGIAVIGSSTSLTQHTGSLHPLAVVFWFGMGQMIDFKSYRKGSGNTASDNRDHS